MKVQLVCSFVDKRSLDRELDLIVKNHKVLFDKIFIFESDDIKEYIVSYNIDKDYPCKFLDNTVLVHRNKDTNTLYTINALNELIKKINNGILDKDYSIRWENYKNKLLVTNGDELNEIDLILKDKTRIVRTD